MGYYQDFSLDFVKENKGQLIAAGCKRKFIVQRLCENPEYRLNRSNLSDYDYLWLVSVTKRSISDTTAKEILWTTIKDICQSPIPPFIVNYVGRTDFEKLDKVLYHLEILGKTEITESFMAWYSEVKNKIDVRNIQILHNILHDAIEMDDRNDPYNMLIDLLKQNLPSLCFSWNL